MTLQHLRPLNSSSNVSNDTGQSARVSTASNNNSNISQAFEALGQERSKIRAQQMSAENTLQTNNNQVSQLLKSSDQQSSAVQNTQRSESDYRHKSVNSTTNADRLRAEARTLRSDAEGRDSSTARQLKLQAKNKEEEAKREDARAKEAFKAQEQAHRVLGREMQSRQDIQSNLGQALSESSASLSVVSNSSAQSNKNVLGFAGGAASRVSNPTGGAVLGRVNNALLGYAGIPGLTGPDVANVNANGSWASYLNAAIGLLRAIHIVTANAQVNANPIVHIAKNLTNKGLSEQAITNLEAALVDSTVQGTPANQQILLTKGQANTLHGEAETNIAYWKEVLSGNKQLEKDTQDLAKRA